MPGGDKYRPSRRRWPVAVHNTEVLNVVEYYQPFHFYVHVSLAALEIRIGALEVRIGSSLVC